jgi:hypothetical protein
MVKATVEREGGGKLLLLGITPENVRRMRAGRPVYVNGKEVGMPGVEVAVMFGETERALLEDLRKQGVELPANAETQVATVEALHRLKGTTP